MKFQLPLLLALATSLSAVPSDINYQGRLTDANGDAVTGDVSMSVKMYDAQSGGNEIYSEDIGTVTLDENGVYSFQFGASGNSTVTKTETIVTSDGTSTEYTGAFTSTPIDGTISVTDATYSWNDVDGNPGEQATAYIIIINGFVIFADIENGGSGYDDDNPPLVTITGDGSGATATATVEGGIITGIALPNAGNNYTEGDITIAPPPAPFTVDKVDGNLEIGYESSPNFGIGVIATYKTFEQSIIGALSEASSHWIELTVDGTAQNPRERILSVPFAQVAGYVGDKKDNDLNFIYQRKAAINIESAIEVLSGESIEILSILGDGGYNNKHLCISDEFLGSTVDFQYGLKLPIIIPGTTRVWASTTNGGNNGNNPLGLMYKIIKDPNTFYGRELTADYNSSVDVSEDEAIEIISIFGDGRQSNRYLRISDELFGSTVDFQYGLELPIIITGPAKIWASTSYPGGNNPKGVTYIVYNSDGSMKNISNSNDSNSNDSNSNDSYENSTFSIIDSSFTWEEARIDAESRGGRLAVLNTQEKIVTFNSWFQDAGSYYIGATDFNSEGNWVWVNGASVIENNWMANEPNNYNNAEHYIAVDGSKLWNDVPLDSNFGYILETPSN
jgi:hypothetical protein